MNGAFNRKINLLDKFYLVFSTLMTTLLGLVLPFSILIIFDRILPNQSTDSLFVLYAIIITAIFLDHFLKTQEEKVSSLITKRYESDITNRVFHAICNANIKDYRKMEMGNYLERIGTIPEIKSFFGGESIKALINLMTSMVTILIVFVINSGAGIALAVASFALLLSAKNLSKKRIALLEIRSNTEGMTNSKIIEIVSNPLDVKSRTMEYRFESIMNSMVREREDHNVEYEKLESSFNLILSLIQQLSIAIVVVTCATAVIELEISQGVMAAVILLTNRYFSPYQQVMHTYSRWGLNKLHLKNVCEILELEEKDPKEPTAFSFKISAIINNKSINLAGNTGYLLKGTSGSGKSKFIRALMLEENHNDYKVMIDGIEISKVDYNSWKSSISKIDSYSSLVEGNIIENLTSFRPYLSNAAYALCENIGITAEINQLKDGFYTQLKGNQQNPFPRRTYFSLLIIRALLSNKKLIVIDDFDMFFENEFGKRVISCIENKASKTMFIIVSNKCAHKSDKIKSINFDSGLDKSNSKQKVA